MINFILGILFDEVGLPIISSLVELVQLAIEKKKGKYALDIAKMNKEVAELTQPEEEPIQTHVMGFQIPSHEEEFDEDDDF